MVCATSGMKVADLAELVRHRGGDPRHMLRVMRCGRRLGVRWSVHERDGFLKLTYLGGGVHAA
jgi:hypothetical protein